MASTTPFDVSSHLTHNLLGKRTSLCRGADKYRHFGVAHNIEQRDGACTGKLPSGNVLTLAHQRLLSRSNPLAAFDEQSATIECIDAVASLLFAESFFFHCCNQQVYAA